MEIMHTLEIYALDACLRCKNEMQCFKSQSVLPVYRSIRLVLALKRDGKCFLFLGSHLQPILGDISITWRNIAQ